MNTKWKEEFKEKFKHSQFVNYSAIKAFIQDQITKTQQEIAEQIIEELNKLKKEQLDTTDPDNYEACYAIAGFNDAISQAKDQLRIKYLNESEKV